VNVWGRKLADTSRQVAENFHELKVAEILWVVVSFRVKIPHLFQDDSVQLAPTQLKCIFGGRSIVQLNTDRVRL
jgi:hypothetical protein